MLHTDGTLHSAAAMELPDALRVLDFASARGAEIEAVEAAAGAEAAQLPVPHPTPPHLVRCC